MDSEGRPDSGVVREVARQIDSAADLAGDPNDVFSLLNLPDGDGPLRSVATAFQYVETTPQPGRTQSGRFGPCLVMSDGSQLPPPLSQLSRSEGALWEAVAYKVRTPIAQARLNDICFEAKLGHPGHHSRAAIEGYIKVGSRDTRSIEENLRLGAELAAVKSLGRAVDLAKRTKQPDLAEAALIAARAAAADAIDAKSSGPGVVLGLIDVLLNGAAPSEILSPLLEKVRAIHEGNAFLTTSTIELQLRVAGISPLRREQLRREIVEAWVTEADRNAGMVRMTHLETAIKIARKYGFNDLVGQITRSLQAMQVDDLGLVRRSYPITIPQEALDEYFNHFTGAATWHDALTLLLQAGPPSGNVESNRAAVAEAAQLAPLLALIPRVRLGGDGLPRYTASTEDDRDDWQLTQHEMRLATIQAHLIAEALRRVWQKWGPISEGDLASFLESPQAQPALARGLARDFLRYFRGDAEGAAYSTAPRVESLVRAITLAIPLPIYRTQRERTPGQYPGLGALVPSLIEAGMDESWGRYIYSLLASPMGANLRNELLHGFMDQVGEPTAALILVAALYLAVGVKLCEVLPPNGDSPATQPRASQSEF